MQNLHRARFRLQKQSIFYRGSFTLSLLRGTEIKGHDAVMDAWPLVKSYVPDAKLVIVGTGNDEDRLHELTYKSNADLAEKAARY